MQLRMFETIWIALHELIMPMRWWYFQDVSGVIIGGTIGHALCTGLAVLGGRFIAQRISVRTGK